MITQGKWPLWGDYLRLLSTYLSGYLSYPSHFILVHTKRRKPLRQRPRTRQREHRQFIFFLNELNNGYARRQKIKIFEMSRAMAKLVL